MALFIMQQGKVVYDTDEVKSIRRARKWYKSAGEWQSATIWISRVFGGTESMKGYYDCRVYDCNTGRWMYFHGTDTVPIAQKGIEGLYNQRNVDTCVIILDGTCMYESNKLQGGLQYRL